MNYGRTASFFEKLEDRRLLSSALSPHIINVFPDNRGQVLVQFDRSLAPATVNANTFALYTSGTDGRFGTADDVKVNATVNYTDANRTVTLRANLAANTPYRIRVTDAVTGAAGGRLDGEYAGVGLPSGNGIPGGAYDVVTTANSQNIVRYTTRAGSFRILLRNDVAPQTVANFLAYANSGVYDSTFFHRSVALNNSLTDPADFVVQGGGFYVDSANQVDQITAKPPVVNEFNLSNIAGTIAMAKTPDNPNSATNQWFFNLKDNSEILDGQNGGFTVFATMLTEADFNVVKSIANFQRVDAGSPFDDLPVVNRQTVIDRNNIDPRGDLIHISRVAQELSVAPMASYQIQATGDFNGDGFDDVVYRDLVSGANVIWYMQNGSRVGTQPLPAVRDLTWIIAGAGDFNGDGKMDLVWRNKVSGLNTVSLLDNGAITNFRAIPPIYNVDWQVGAIADFNKDGNVDVLWRNYNTGQHSFWLLNGNFAVPAYATLPTVVDTNQYIAGSYSIGNGNRALLFRNSVTGANTAWRLNGTAVASFQALQANTNLSQTLIGGGRFNNDDQGDLLFGTHGQNAYQFWFMNGATRIGLANLS